MPITVPITTPLTPIFLTRMMLKIRFIAEAMPEYNISSLSLLRPTIISDPTETTAAKNREITKSRLKDAAASNPSPTHSLISASL